MPSAAGVLGIVSPRKLHDHPEGLTRFGRAGVEVHHADVCAGHLARTAGLSTLTFVSDSPGTKSASDKRGNPSTGGQ